MGNAPQYLEAYQAFIDGDKLTDAEIELSRATMVAGCFAAQAYEIGMAGGSDIHALTLAFLQALVDPSHPSLDYLRADPASGQVARDASARVMNIAKGGA